MTLRSPCATTLIVLSVLMQAAGTSARKEFQWDGRKALELTWERSIIANKNLTAREKAGLIRVLANELKAKELNIRSESELREAAEGSAVELLDLNGDGIPEAIARGLGLKAGCGATGNCPVWILARNASEEYSVLLRAQAQTVTVQTTHTRGFRDVVLGTHMSASETLLRVYRFDGHTFRPTDCHRANFLVEGRAGEFQEVKTPRITPCTD